MPDLIAPVVAAGSLGRQPTLRAGELLIRPWAPDDAGAVAAAYADPDIQQWHAQSLTLAEAQAWIRSREKRWAREQGADWAVTDGRLLGRIGLRALDLAGGQAEVAYWVLPAARGRGVAVRALEALAVWAFGVGLERLELRHSTRNPASGRVAAKAGFVFEGTLRRQQLHADGWHDMHVHSRLRGDSQRCAVHQDTA